MITIQIPTDGSITRFNIGRRGENEAVQVVFDVTPLIVNYGDGDAILLSKRSEDSYAYPVEVTRDGSNVTWVVTNTDTNYKGFGKAELFWYVGGTLAKSLVYTTYVSDDIIGGGEAPEPYDNWLETLTQIANEVRANAESAESSKEAAESSADLANGYAEDALASKTAAATSASQSAESASQASTYASNASASASTASTKASEAASSASSAASSATAANNSKTAAQTAKTQAESAKTAAQQAQTAAETAAQEAQNILASTIYTGNDGQFYIRGE